MAAPILKEWEDMDVICCGLSLFNMEARPVNRGPKRHKYGCKHLLMKVLISIRKARITKDEYFLTPTYVNDPV